MLISGETSFGTIELQVTPEQMTQTASGIMNKISEVQGLFEEISEKMRRTTAYWEGDVGNNERKTYEGNQDDIDLMIKNLKNYVLELKLMAMNYTLTETAVTQISEALPSNILE